MVCFDEKKDNLLILISLSPTMPSSRLRMLLRARTKQHLPASMSRGNVRQSRNSRSSGKISVRTAGWIAAGLAAIGLTWFGLSNARKSGPVTPAHVDGSRVPERAENLVDSSAQKEQDMLARPEESSPTKPEENNKHPIPKSFLQKFSIEKDPQKAMNTNIESMHTSWKLKEINWEKPIWKSFGGRLLSTMTPDKLVHNHVYEVKSEANEKIYILVAKYPGEDPSRKMYTVFRCRPNSPSKMMLLTQIHNWPEVLKNLDYPKCIAEYGPK